MTRLENIEQDVFIEVVCFLDPPTEEMVIHNADDSYTIFVNADIAYDRQVKAVEHALTHIQNNDFEKDDVQEIEAKAHQIEEVEISDAIESDDKNKAFEIPPGFTKYAKFERLPDWTPEERAAHVEMVIQRELAYLKERYTDHAERYHKMCEERMKYDPQFFEEHNIFW